MQCRETLVDKGVAILPPTSVAARLLPCGVAAAAMLNLLFFGGGVVAARVGAAADGDIAFAKKGKSWLASSQLGGARG